MDTFVFTITKYISDIFNSHVMLNLPKSLSDLDYNMVQAIHLTSHLTNQIHADDAPRETCDDDGSVVLTMVSEVSEA